MYDKIGWVFLKKQNNKNKKKNSIFKLKFKGFGYISISDIWLS